MYIINGIAFHGLGLCSFGNDFGRNGIIFGVDNSSSSHTDNHKDFLMLGKGPTDDINNSIEEAESLTLMLVKQKDKILLDFALQW